MISRMSSRVRSGRVHAPRRFARPALVAVVVVSVVGVVGVVVGVERGRRGEERERERDEECILSTVLWHWRRCGWMDECCCS